MSAKNPKAGRGPCPNCGSAGTVFRLSPASKKLSYTCDECDHSAYADHGGAAHAKWTAAMTTTPVATTPVATTPKPESVVATTPAARGGFNLASL